MSCAPASFAPLRSSSSLHPESVGVHRWTYPIIGVALALGCPAGLLLLRSVLHGQPGSLHWMRPELASEWVTYTYLLLSTAMLFVVLGWLVGRKEDALRATSATDPLTGLWNRRYVRQRLVEELHRARRYHLPLSVLMIDLDGLKRINDAYGHDAGDTALQVIAEGLGAAARRTDIVGRYGGDEFMIVAPETRAGAAFELAERIRERISRTEREPSLSVSIGVADLARVGAFDADVLSAAADRALYAAKRAGRNRTIIASNAVDQTTTAR